MEINLNEIEQCVREGKMADNKLVAGEVRLNTFLLNVDVEDARFT